MTSRVARALKRALIGGLNLSGITVEDIELATVPLTNSPSGCASADSPFSKPSTPCSRPQRCVSSRCSLDQPLRRCAGFGGDFRARQHPRDLLAAMILHQRGHARGNALALVERFFRDQQMLVGEFQSPVNGPEPEKPGSTGQPTPRLFLSLIG